MRIGDLRECVVLAETLSFTETARRLCTTQSAVSKHIQSLEQDLGTSLFMRTKRYVTLMFEHVRNFADLDSEFKYLRLEECPQDFNVVAVWKKSTENDVIVDMARIMQEEVQASKDFPRR